jgi:hypothetical protein
MDKPVTCSLCGKNLIEITPLDGSPTNGIQVFAPHECDNGLVFVTSKVVKP